MSPFEWHLRISFSRDHGKRFRKICQISISWSKKCLFFYWSKIDFPCKQQTTEKNKPLAARPALCPSSWGKRCCSRILHCCFFRNANASLWAIPCQQYSKSLVTIEPSFAHILGPFIVPPRDPSIKKEYFWKNFFLQNFSTGINNIDKNMTVEETRNRSRGTRTCVAPIC